MRETLTGISMLLGSATYSGAHLYSVQPVGEIYLSLVSARGSVGRL